MKLLMKEKDTAILIPKKRLDVVIFRDDDQYTAFCPDLDLATAQDTPEKAMEDIIVAIKEYSKDYMKNYDAYSRSPNRKQHLPLVGHIADAKEDWEIREMIEVRYGDLYIRPVQKGS